MKYLTVGTKELKNNMLYEVEDVENFNALKPRGGLWLSEQNENLTYNRWIDYLIEHPYTLRRKSKNNEIFICNARHESLINSAYNSIVNAIKTLDNNLPEDLLSIDLRDAYDFLGQITGKTINDKLTNEIFSKFCVGK